MGESPRLGPFQVHECIGVGGMGEVFRGVHEGTGVAVAIKVIRGQVEHKSMTAFHREIQAQARLAHPRIVHLFDYGEVTADAARASDGTLEAGNPYVAMELAPGHTLREAMPLRNWGAVRDVLLQVLDGLAFAHARGVIHRDIKPANLLLFGTDHPLRDIKLADFGLVHAIDEAVDLTEEALSGSSGTPQYIPPEQAHGRWRTYGPWTDLYSLGCMAWQMVCGRPPYGGESPLSVVMKHFTSEIPPLTPLFPVPASAQEWITKAMAKEPSERFQSAAEAAWALPKMAAGASLTASAGATKEGDEQPTTDFDLETTVLMETLLLDTSGIHPRETSAVGAGTTGTRMPLPATWRSSGAEELPTNLVGTGLGLFGLREAPFVDRDEQRDAIWCALEDGVRSGEFRAIFVTGGPGVGKSRLVQWMARRTQELGAASPLHIHCTPEGQGLVDGFGGMVQRAFRTWKLSRGQLYEDLKSRLPPLPGEESSLEADARALTELVHPTERDASAVDGPRFHFSSPRQKYALIRRLLQRLAGRTTLFLGIDDLHTSYEALGLLDYLVHQHPWDTPGLFVATVRDDLVGQDPDLAAKINSLLEHPSCLRIDLEGLSAADHRELIHRMLPLASEMADDLAKRTEGNPLFAHQLLRHWIQCDSLEIAGDGFRVVPGEELSLPDDIHQLWVESLDRLFGRFPPGERQAVEQAIELAAALGRELRHDEWEALCTDDQRRLLGRLTDLLMQWGLMRRSDAGWSFAHGLLVDSLRRRALEENRWQNYHQRCAEMLKSRYPHHQEHTAWRRANHWMETEQDERALPLLGQASEYFRTRGLTQRRREALELQRDLLDRLGRPSDDPDRLDHDLRMAMLHNFEGDPEASVEIIEEVLRSCHRESHRLLQIRSHASLSMVLSAISDTERARREILRGLELAEEEDDDYWLGKLYTCRGVLEFNSGNLDDADLGFQQSTRHYRRVDASYEELWSDVYRGWICLSRGDFPQGLEILEGALGRARRQGFQHIVSHCLNGLGDLSRFTHRLHEARHYYEHSRQLDRELGDPQADVVGLANLMQVDLASGDLEAGEARLQTLEARCQALALGHYREVFSCAHVLLDSAYGKTAEVRRWLDEVGLVWADDRPLWRDHPWLLEFAAHHMEEAAMADEAHQTWRLIADLWGRLGDEEAADRARRKASAASQS